MGKKWAVAVAAAFVLAGTGLAQGVGAGQRFERLDTNRDGRVQRRELPERTQRRLDRLGREGVTREQLERFRVERPQTRERLEVQGQRRAESFEAQSQRRGERARVQGEVRAERLQAQGELRARRTPAQVEPRPERFEALREMRRTNPEQFRELRELRRQTRERSLETQRAAPPRAPRRSI